MKHLSRFAFADRKGMTLLLVTSLLIGAAVIGQSYYFVAIVDRIFLDQQSLQDVLPLFAGLFLVLAGRTLFTWLNGRTGIRLASRAKAHYRRRLIEKLSRQSVSASVTGQSGQKVSVLMDSVDELDGYFSRYIPQMIQTLIIPLMILVVVFSAHLYSGLIMVITAPFIPMFMAIIGVMTKKKSEDQMEKLSAFSGQFLDTLQGLVTLKLFNRSHRQQEEIKTSSLGFKTATMEVLKVAFVSSLMLEFISMLSIGLIALEIAIRLVVYESVSFFTAFFILILAPEFYLTLKEFGSAFHTGRGASGASKQLEQALSEEERSLDWGERAHVYEQPPALTLQHVQFQYEEGFALEPVSVHVPAASHLAVVGRSGSGKTTLLNIFSGLLAPSSGEVELNGRALYSYKEADWFNGVSYISQHPYLFSGTIAENIAIGVPGASKETVAHAAGKAGLSLMLETLEDGLDTTIGEGGRGLSGGEKQRIALARAFLKKPSVILFDEPTTGLDVKTETVLQRSIQELSETATMITVAHRLHTIQAADQILVLDEGRAVGTGTHEQLKAELPLYRQMVTMQKGGEGA
ncbi:thiol reductant ABC exporter subunit CydD [Halobacillus litoralis]|uniref:thiol reductant ABC exporter subunit CydD n=1 Tax=Halobacillus litoralis TaxID=45668 RepID=UPI001CD54DBD|nr:thiol reductant ABC exporter subunit CydD [Halobacillus litoralis]MCA1024240.1 thiol reductant ABC exporter subunit CydD [Halobacillus litoralis]